MQRTEAKKTVERLTGKAERKKKIKSAELSSFPKTSDSMQQGAPLVRKPLPDIRPKVFC